MTRGPRRQRAGRIVACTTRFQLGVRRTGLFGFEMPQGGHDGEVTLPDSGPRGADASFPRRPDQVDNGHELLMAVLESMDTGVVACDAEGVLTLFNRATREMHGISEEALLPEEWADRYSLFQRDGRTPMKTEDIPLLRALRGERVREAEMVIAPTDGPPRTVLCSGQAMRSPDGRVIGAVVAMHDVTDRRRAEERLAHQALHDPLTGLANRLMLLDRLSQALLRQKRRQGITAVIFLNLDDFKAINDSHGHDVGDRVLVAVGERLSDALRAEDTIARYAPAAPSSRRRSTIGRLGGDEFVLLLEDLSRPADGAIVAERVLAELRVPFTVGTDEISLDASIGITLAVGPTRSPAEMLRDGDTAMYAAKSSGKGRFEFFEAEMRAEVEARTTLVHEMRSVIAQKQLRLVYQPQVDLATGRMTGIEALVRWQHPEHGLLTPDRFLPLAESAGLIVTIDDWVMREACTQLRAWDDAGLPALHMAINVSAARLSTKNFAEDLATVLADTGLGAERLEVEITETVAVENDAVAVATINAIRELGVRVAIDDFGMGHSSLSRLQTFPVDRLKIDRAFISPLSSREARGSIADAMIAIGQSLGLDIVAEGVETREHLHALRALGCRSAQGYLFSKPIQADSIARLARSGSSLAPAADRPGEA